MLKLFPFKAIACAILTVVVLCWQTGQVEAQMHKTYVGSEACQNCHDAQYDRFKSYAKKAQSYDHIMKLRKGLSEAEFEQCLECHTTGYGKPGGFRSEQETPHLKEAGCEVCHGPGSIHIVSQDPLDIKRNMSTRDCEACHNSERVEAFRYKPMIFGGAH